jgi:hypothetical protein
LQSILSRIIAALRQSNIPGHAKQQHPCEKVALLAFNYDLDQGAMELIATMVCEQLLGTVQVRMGVDITKSRKACEMLGNQGSCDGELVASSLVYPDTRKRKQHPVRWMQ